MKLQCQVEVINRFHSAMNVRNSCKYVKSTLAIGKEPKTGPEYFILHFSAGNKNGTKYRIKNISQLFVKFINDGKSTIRFDEPPHDLCIKSECILLKSFMRLLKCCISGGAKALQLAPLASLSITAKNNAPTKLVIHDRNEIPSKGLPRTLESLHMSGLKLCNFRREILLLKRLTVLDLSNNEIEKIPSEFGRIPTLRELYLANNQLGIKQELDWSWLLGPQISKTLRLLDLSGNKLENLPKAIWKLQQLVTLNLHNNLLQRLPATLGRITSLRFLTVSQNNLETLPCSLLQCRLERFEIFSNKFRTQQKLADSKTTPWEFYVGNLVNLAAKVVLKHKLYYAPNIIPLTLVNYLDDANMCICGNPVITDMMSYSKEFDLKYYIPTVIVNLITSSKVQFECYFCSSRCFKQNA